MDDEAIGQPVYKPTSKTIWEIDKDRPCIEIKSRFGRLRFNVSDPDKAKEMYMQHFGHLSSDGGVLYDDFGNVLDRDGNVMMFSVKTLR